MTEVELKPLGVRISTVTRERFANQAAAEGLGQTEMLEKIMAHYFDGPSEQPPFSTAEITPEEPAFEAEKFDHERAELSHATATIKEAAQSLEALARKIKESEGAEGYKRSLKEVAEEAAAINTLLGGIKRLHEIIASSHKLIMEASENASEPFQKIILDQAEQAEKFAGIYKSVATSIQALDKASSEAVQKAQKISHTLDHQVTTALVESSQRIHEKTISYLDRRNGFLNFLMGGMIAAVVVAGGSLFYSTLFVKKQADSTLSLAQSCVSFYGRFEAAACDFRKGRRAKIEELMTTADCK